MREGGGECAFPILTTVVHLGIVVEELLGGHVVTTKDHIVTSIAFFEIRQACVSGNTIYMKTAFFLFDGRIRRRGMHKDGNVRI